MTEILIYTATGILLYGLADAILKFIERIHGDPIPHRSIVFFIIIFMMAMIVFQLINLIFVGDPKVSP